MIIKNQKSTRKGLKSVVKTKSKCRKMLKHPFTAKKTVRELDKLKAVQFAEKILLALLSDFFQTLPLYRLADYRQDVRTVQTRMKAEGLSFATKTITCLSQGMFDHLEGRVASYPTFKLWNRTHPVFLKGLFENALGYTNESSGDHSFRTKYIEAIYQFSVIFKKLKGPYKKSKLAEQYANFVKVDEELGKIDLTAECLQPILRRAAYLCSQLIKEYDPLNGNVIPRPGPGATNKPTKKYERYEPRQLFRQVHNVCDYRDWFFVNGFDVNYDTSSFLQLLKNATDEPTSRFKFVPKTWEKARGICIEEFEVQWIQQGVRRGLTNLIASHPFYNARIKLNDQSVNGNLALESSRWRTKATIDMSEASDRVLRRLVKYLFSSNPELCEQLMALSTRIIEPPKEVKGQKPFRTHKFAPMGSALCFPIMSLVHMMLIRAIIQLSNVEYPHFQSAQVHVYGDDIVIPSSCVQAVYDWLPKFGIKLNETKSFFKSYFRESCGMHAYYGSDITPIFIRELPKHWHGKSLKSLIETEFMFHTKGRMAVARTIRESLISDSKQIDRYVHKTSNVVGFVREYDDPYVPSSKRELPFTHKVKYDENIQQFFRQDWVFTTNQKSVGLSSDYHRYLRWYAEQPESRYVSDTNDALFVRREWVPQSDCALGSLH